MLSSIYRSGSEDSDFDERLITIGLEYATITITRPQITHPRTLYPTGQHPQSAHQGQDAQTYKPLPPRSGRNHRGRTGAFGPLGGPEGGPKRIARSECRAAPPATGSPRRLPRSA